MSQEPVLGIYVFIMAMFVGFEVISRVPSVLHKTSLNERVA